MAASAPRDTAGISVLDGLALLAALAAGATLRLWNLGAQVLSGDEFHAIIAALERPVSRILFVYQEADNCIPLTVLDRLFIDSGVALNEWIVRLPVLITGLALLLIAPVWAWRRLGMGTAVALAWLVAISPGLVFYSRIARSYAPATLFGCAAVAAFENWHRRGGIARGATYVALAVTAIWFHLGVAPLVLSPVLVAALALAAARGRGLRRLLLLGTATVAALLALLAPAHPTLVPFLGNKHGKLDLLPHEATEVWTWLAGARSPWAAAAITLVFFAGLAALLRREGWLGGFVLGAVAGQLAGVLWLAPVAHQSTTVLARYLVFALPSALVPIAVALGSPWPSRWRPAQPWLGAVAVAGLLACGPFLDPDLARTSFAHDELFLRFTQERPRLDPEGQVDVYHWLAQAAPGAVTELPWDPVFMFDRVFGLYQTIHRRQVVVAFRPEGRLKFRNMTSDLPQELLAARGRWLIVHPEIVRDEERIGGSPWTPTRGLRRLFRRLALSSKTTYRELWGEPDYEDAWASVWDLDRVRRKFPQRTPVTGSHIW